MTQPDCRTALVRRVTNRWQFEQQSMQSETINKPSLLLVEDSEDDAFFFKRTLEKSGNICILHCAANGAEAVEFLRKAFDSQTLPRVIFLDLKMPVLNGFEVLDWLRRQPFAAQVQVIVLSGSEHENDKMRATQLGASAYLVKPVRTGDLDRFLRDVCPADTEMGASS